MNQRIGQQVGTYRLLHVLGEGGFATVYLGEHVHLGTLAALKLLHVTFSSEDLEAFRREAQLIARLEHPHIVRVLDYDVQAGTPFLVLSFAPGGTLRSAHPKGTVLPLTKVVDYVAQVSEALQYAHDRGIIHRDVKPENLLVGARQEVLLGDFGIAVLSQRSRSVSTQEVVGTAAYMAPEQFRGKPGVASDQYALAVVVYEWLTGERPFSGSFVELASQHLLTPAPGLRQKNAGISSAVERVVLTALAKDPARRFGSVRGFATALEQAAHTLSPTIPAHALPPVDHGVSAVIAPTIPPTASELASLSPGLARPSRQLQMADPGAREPAKRRRARRTRRVRAICFVLFVASVLLWLITAADPALHGWFAGAILLTLVFWIAAYADHRRATEDPGATNKR
ncbi:MAG TPA: serine/threonine-protein kinase [Ktedonobacteraceae bacterium]|jgi:serine/threonine protein kinase|nr:serine/threonine-protein kinase [Ktedonobacteraceae bacterium]